MIPLALVVAGVSGMWWLRLRKPGPLRLPRWHVYRCCARSCPRVFDDRYERWLHEKRAHQLR